MHIIWTITLQMQFPLFCGACCGLAYCFWLGCPLLQFPCPLQYCWLQGWLLQLGWLLQGPTIWFSTTTTLRRSRASMLLPLQRKMNIRMSSQKAQQKKQMKSTSQRVVRSMPSQQQEQEQRVKGSPGKQHHPSPQSTVAPKEVQSLQLQLLQQSKSLMQSHRKTPPAPAVMATTMSMMVMKQHRRVPESQLRPFSHRQDAYPIAIAVLQCILVCDMHRWYQQPIQPLDHESRQKLWRGQYITLGGSGCMPQAGGGGGGWQGCWGGMKSVSGPGTGGGGGGGGQGAYMLLGGGQGLQPCCPACICWQASGLGVQFDCICCCCCLALIFLLLFLGGGGWGCMGCWMLLLMTITSPLALRLKPSPLQNSPISRMASQPAQAKQHTKRMRQTVTRKLSSQYEKEQEMKKLFGSQHCWYPQD